MKTTINELNNDFLEALKSEINSVRSSILGHSELRVELNDRRNDPFVNKITCRILTPAYFGFKNYSADKVIISNSYDLNLLVRKL